MPFNRNNRSKMMAKKTRDEVSYHKAPGNHPGARKNPHPAKAPDMR